MKIELTDRRMLIIAMAVTALAVLSSILLPETAISFAMMIPFFFFLPGYALTRALFARKLELDVFLLASIALSAVSSILVALALAATPIGQSQMSVLIAIGALTFIGFAADIYRHRENRRFEIVIALPKRGDVDVVIAVAMVFGLVLIGVFSYLIITAQRPSDTHINLLSESGDVDLPDNATVGSQVNFTVAMKNGEGHGAEFKVVIYNNSALYGGAESVDSSYIVTLGNGQSAEHDFSLIFTEAGEQNIQARVFIDGEFYGELHFKIEVS